MNWAPEQVEAFGLRLKALRDTELFCLLLDLQDITNDTEEPNHV